MEHKKNNAVLALAPVESMAEKLSAWRTQYGEVVVLEVKQGGAKLGELYFKPPTAVPMYRNFMSRFLSMHDQQIERGELVFNSCYLGGIQSVSDAKELVSDARDTSLFVHICVALSAQYDKAEYNLSFTTA